jgi:hypothetical protein
MFRTQLGFRLAALVVLVVGAFGLTYGATTEPTVIDLSSGEVRAVTGGDPTVCYTNGTSSCGDLNVKCNLRKCDILQPGGGPVPKCPNDAVEEEFRGPYDNASRAGSGLSHRKVVTLINCKKIYKCQSAGVGDTAGCRRDEENVWWCRDGRGNLLSESDGREESVPDGDICLVKTESR